MVMRCVRALELNIIKTSHISERKTLSRAAAISPGLVYNSTHSLAAVIIIYGIINYYVYLLVGFVHPPQRASLFQ
jgi:hypothetical protein